MKHNKSEAAITSIKKYHTLYAIIAMVGPPT